MHNDFPAPVYYQGEMYKTASHAFNAARATDPILRRRIQKAPTLKEMYNMAHTLEDPPGWEY